MTLLLALLILLFLAPSDGGNHPRKDPAMNQPHRFHPPKSWD